MPPSSRGPRKGVPTGARPYERVHRSHSERMEACLLGSGLTSTARRLIMVWAAMGTLRMTPSQVARRLDCHRRTAERTLSALVRGGWARLVSPGSWAHHLASDYELVLDRLPRFGDRIRRKRASEAAQRGLGREASLPDKSAANCLSPESLRTLKISEPPTTHPMASKRARDQEPRRTRACR